MNPFANVTKWYSYNEFLAFTEELVAANKTTGTDQSPEMVEYTRLNLHRMQRWNKTFKVSDSLQQAAQSAQRQIWWVITEPWCGDSAHTLAQLAGIAAASAGRIELRILLRDEHHDIIDRYLTNGSRSIPILVSLNESGEQLFVWGPRPAILQQKVLEWKKEPGEKSYDDLKTEVHLWYSHNKGAELSREIAALI